MIKLELEIPKMLFAEIELIATIKCKKPIALILDEITQVFHAYVEDCKHLLE